MSYWAAAVYLLCFATSVTCAGLLVRSYMRKGTRLLFASAACFVMLAVNNLFVVLDILVFPQVDLRIWRELATLVGLALLIYGFVWEGE